MNVGEEKATLKFILFNLALGICFTILITAPGVQFIGKRILGYPHDGFAYIWKMWWWNSALLDHHTIPSHMSYVNYPYHGQNPHLIASPLIPVLASPLVDWLGLLRTYNILLLAAFALSWPTAALLCYEFFPSRWAASLGGAVYAFYPNKVAHAVGGHLAQTFVFLFPLGVLFLYRSWKTPTKRRVALVAGSLLALSALVDLKHIALFVAPLVVLFYGFYSLAERQKRNRARLMSVATTLGVTALLAGPFLAPLVVDRFSGRLGHFSAEGVVRHSADLTSFLVPPPEHPVYSAIEPLRVYSVKLAREGWHENIFYLGIVTLVLSAIGAWKHHKERNVKFWCLVAISGAVLALGPLLKVGGRPVSLRVDRYASYIPMPYYVLRSLPFYDWARTPGRIVEMTMLALAVLATGGAAALLQRCRKALRPVFALGLVFLVLVDSLFVWPWPLGDAQIPSFHRRIAKEDHRFAILDLPLWQYRCERYQLYYATIHERPVVGGLVTRRSPEAERTMRRVEQLVQADSGLESAESLADLGIRYVVLHKLCLSQDALSARSAFLRSELGPRVYDDRWIRAFEVPGRPTIPTDWLEGQLSLPRGSPES